VFTTHERVFAGAADQDVEAAVLHAFDASAQYQDGRSPAQHSETTNTNALRLSRNISGLSIAHFNLALYFSI